MCHATRTPADCQRAIPDTQHAPALGRGVLGRADVCGRDVAHVDDRPAARKLLVCWRLEDALHEADAHAALLAARLEGQRLTLDAFGETP